MAKGENTPKPAEARLSRVFYFNGGFRAKRIRRILQLAGYNLRLGWPTAHDQVVIWGNSPTAKRGKAVIEKTKAAPIYVEDAWLRSLFPGRAGEPPMGLVIDHATNHFDASRASDLETLLATHPFDDGNLIRRATTAMERIKDAHLSKYAAYDLDAPLPEPGYVLVIDQTRGDASVRANNGSAHSFHEMLMYAIEENPHSRIVIKTHPETQKGYRAGHFGPEHLRDNISFFDQNVSPWALLEGAVKVYAVSSQMGFEAILAGHTPILFGKPFYAGWGLSEDRFPIQRRKRKLTRAQLFAGAMILYPKWFDPHNDRLCQIETVIDSLEACARAWREDHRGWVATGMRLWKRGPMQQFFGGHRRMIFADPFDAATQRAERSGRPMMAWATKADGLTCTRVEDGFLRSRGLGAELIAPMSLVLDRTGIYYDPSAPSDLEALILKRATLRDDQRIRADRLIEMLRRHKLSKYNQTGEMPELRQGRRILVPGQVEDDASILKGASEVRTNLQLLEQVRAHNPVSVIIYKPHPDVMAGLRKGAIEAMPDGLADHVIAGGNIADLIEAVDEVWTITSLTGFEALLRGKKVVTFGVPFYSGWGLTRDLGAVPDRRKRLISLQGLVHAALIDYPRYYDPVAGLPASVEVIAERLRTGDIPRPSRANRLLAKAQGIFASYAHVWRR